MRELAVDERPKARRVVGVQQTRRGGGVAQPGPKVERPAPAVGVAQILADAD